MWAKTAPRDRGPEPDAEEVVEEIVEELSNAIGNVKLDDKKTEKAETTAPKLDEEQFRRIAQYGVVEYVEVGQVLYAAGDASYDFFLLQTATVEITRGASLAERKPLIYPKLPGDYMGELNLLTGQRVYLTARVTGAGTVVRIDASGSPAAPRR